MPIIRNPFRKQDENVRPTSNGIVNGAPKANDQQQPIAIASKKEPAEYQLSEINDSGVYLPPPTPERKSLWHTNSSRSTTSSNHRSLINENEQFNISRESFESYRRSFDISARSPVIAASESRPRASLDSHSLRTPPRSSASFSRLPPANVPPTQEEDLEDVNLEDPVKAQQPPRKKGLFSRLTESTDANSERPSSSGGSGGSSSWHHFGGRKRGQSGQGAELGNFPKTNGDSRSAGESKPNGEQVASASSPYRAETPKPDQQHAKQNDAQPPPEIRIG